MMLVNNLNNIEKKINENNVTDRLTTFLRDAETLNEAILGAKTNEDITNNREKLIKLEMSWIEFYNENKMSPCIMYEKNFTELAENVMSLLGFPVEFNLIKDRLDIEHIK